MKLTKNLISILSFCTIVLVSGRAPTLNTINLQQTSNTTVVTGNTTATNTTATNTTNSTVPVENYYKGVRCDWWCPPPDKGMPFIDPPTEIDGCLCEIPDRRPLSEQIFDQIDAFLGGFKATEDF